MRDWARTKARQKQWYKRGMQEAQTEVERLAGLQVVIDGVTYPIEKQWAIRMAIKEHFKAQRA